jgi:hypothetical protein
VPVRAPKKLLKRGKFSHTNTTKQRHIQGLREAKKDQYLDNNNSNLFINSILYAVLLL